MLLSPARGRGWVRGLQVMIVQSDLYRSPDPFRILYDFVDPESEDPPAFAFHLSRPTSICLNLKRVMLAIDLDDEFRGYTGEVGEIRPDRMLSTKFHAGDPTVTDQVPTDLFCSATFAAQLARFRDLVHAPSPSLSP
ncbi:hypothetical protein SAMN02990966_03687 [Rhodospirillales bacterium URHD0017]|nr:hypothetical protein SAMN02990966_03687 [Rhodospirillales bacterium URHD0017]